MPNQQDDAGTGADTPGTAADINHPAPSPDTSGSDSLTIQTGPRHGSTLASLSLAALGVVFGDIGTSPLYSMQTVFSIDHNEVQPTIEHVYGIVSMIFWSVTIIVSIKYVLILMRADNDGEGGILALVALLRHSLEGRRRLGLLVVALGMLGAALFYGDSVITPAISVMSAIEGIAIADPDLEEMVLPLSVVILAVLFSVQRWGTHAVGRAFGPVMTLWFAVLALLGIPHIISHPGVLVALSPTYALSFLALDPRVAFISMGAVVLTITGAEALYADMGHFGSRPIRISWFAVVFPCLTLNYLGQAGMILENPEYVDNPFFRMAPAWATVPLVILATMATVIASQAVISGAYSVSKQASRLGLLPRVDIKHTSKEEGGQIYVPSVNWILFVGVLMLIGFFQSSSRLATAYGLAATGTLLLTTALFLVLARFVWRWAWYRLIVVGLVIGALELTFFSANVTKVLTGGWLPLLIAGLVTALMVTWRRGTEILIDRRAQLEGSLDDFLEELRSSQIPRMKGVAVFPHGARRTTPLALRSNVAFNHALHEHVVIISIVNVDVPHIRHVERISVDHLGNKADGIVWITCKVGFNDSQDAPKALALAAGSDAELDFTEPEALYFMSMLAIHNAGNAQMPAWQRALYVWMSHNAANRNRVLHLPTNRTIVVGAQLDF